MSKGKTYMGFWLGKSWVSRCKRCGTICFNVAQEEEHNKESCQKAKLKPIPPEDQDLNRKGKHE